MESQQSAGELKLEDLVDDDLVGDERLTEKDKIINVSNKKIAVKNSDVINKNQSQKYLNQFQKMKDSAEIHSYLIFDQLRCNLL